MTLFKGWKTYLAAAIAALVAAWKIIDPNGEIIPVHVVNAILAAAAALGIYGLRAAIADGAKK